MNRVLSLFLLCAVAVGSAHAQFPIPARPGAEVLSCAGCPPPQTGFAADGSPILGQPPYPISGPIAAFTGRFLDSNFTRDFQYPFRTARAFRAQVHPARNRVYLHLGSTLAAYPLDTFIQRLETKDPLISVEIPFGKIRFGDWPEYWLPWAKYFYAEKYGSGWYTPVMDGQERLIGFDADDRGYIYLAYSVFGWGIVRDNGGADGFLMENQIQVTGGQFNPVSIFAFRNSAGRYFAMVGPASDGTMRLYDTTDPRNPVRLTATVPSTMYAAATGDRLALVTRDGKVLIYTGDDAVSGGAPLLTATPPGAGAAYVNVTTDGTNFYAVARGQASKYAVNILSRNFVGGFDEHYTLLRQTGSPYTIRWGSGFLSITGMDNSNGENVFLYRVSGNALSEIYLNDYFYRHYVNPGVGYSKPGRGTVYNVLPHVSGSKLYLIVSAFGLGDVYQVAADGFSSEPPPYVPNPPPVTPTPPLPQPPPPPPPTPTPTPPTPVPPSPPPPACPQMNTGGSLVYIDFRNKSNSCNPQDPACTLQVDEPVDFSALSWNYNFSCLSHQFVWDFDGVQKTGREVSHAFASPGRRTVKLRITNGLQTVNLEQQVNVVSAKRRSARR